MSYRQVKEANLKRPHTVRFQLYDILEKAKLRRLEQTRGCQGLGKEEGLSKWSTEDVYRAVELAV